MPECRQWTDAGCEIAKPMPSKPTTRRETPAHIWTDCHAGRRRPVRHRRSPASRLRPLSRSDPTRMGRTRMECPTAKDRAAIPRREKPRSGFLVHRRKAFRGRRWRHQDGPGFIGDERDGHIPRIEPDLLRIEVLKGPATTARGPSSDTAPSRPTPSTPSGFHPRHRPRRLPQAVSGTTGGRRSKSTPSSHDPLAATARMLPGRCIRCLSAGSPAQPPGTTRAPPKGRHIYVGLEDNDHGKGVLATDEVLWCTLPARMAKGPKPEPALPARTCEMLGLKPLNRGRSRLRKSFGQGRRTRCKHARIGANRMRAGSARAPYIGADPTFAPRSAK